VGGEAQRKRKKLIPLPHRGRKKFFVWDKKTNRITQTACSNMLVGQEQRDLIEEWRSVPTRYKCGGDETDGEGGLGSTMCKRPSTGIFRMASSNVLLLQGRRVFLVYRKKVLRGGVGNHRMDKKARHVPLRKTGAMAPDK